MMPHNAWGSSARRPCARRHPPAIGGQSHSCRVLITFMLRQAQHERSHGLFTTRKFAFSLVMPLLNRSTRASQNAILTVRLEHHDTPTLPFALSLSKGEWELRNSYPFARTSTGSARTEPRPLHHTKVCIQPRNAPTQPFDRSITKRHPHRSPGASRYTNLTVRLELVER